MISPRHDEARKVAAVVRQQLKAEGAIGAEDHAVTVLRRMDLGLEACGDLLHYAPGRVVGFHSRTAGGFRPGEKWTVKETNCETVTLERDGKVRQFKPSAKGKWDVLVSSTLQVSVEIRFELQQDSGKGKTCSRTTILPRYSRSPLRSSSYRMAGECAVMVHASIKASVLPLMQANAVRSIRWLCCRTALTRKAGTSAYRGLGTRCTSTRAAKQRCVKR
jgi:hypothetical protein